MTNNTNFRDYCRTQGKGMLLSLWDYEKNEIKPEDIKMNDNRLIHWKCCHGHKFLNTVATISKFSTVKGACPYCRTTNHISFSEKVFAYYISQYVEIKENYKPDFLDRMEIDIYIPSLRIGIEYDGSLYHNEEKYIKRDLKKNKICEEYNIKLLRIRDKECSDESSNGCETFYLISHSANHLNEMVGKVLDRLGIMGYDVNVKRDKHLIKEKYFSIEGKSFFDYCIEHNCKYFLSYWTDKTAQGYSPKDFPYFSGEKLLFFIDGRYEERTIRSLYKKNMKLEKNNHIKLDAQLDKVGCLFSLYFLISI